MPGVLADAFDSIGAQWEGVVDEGGEDIGGGVGSESLLGLGEALGVEWTEVVGGTFDDGGGAAVAGWTDEGGVGASGRAVDVAPFERGVTGTTGTTRSGVGVRGRFDWSAGVRSGCDVSHRCVEAPVEWAPHLVWGR